MKLLLDQNISYRLKNELQEQLSQIEHVNFVGLQDREDKDIWAFAKLHEYTIVTYDADFHELQILNGYPPKIIWIRRGNMTRHDFKEFIISRLKEIEEFLKSQEFSQSGCLIFK